jgi:DNA-binding response OmpR family regulator
MKALIVEDDANLRRTTIRLLRRMFPEVEPACAESADEAIDLLREATIDRGFDLVICDFNLVGVRTGADVLAWIQEHASYLEERFLFLTSDERARTLHPRFLEKPCDVDTLRAAIEATVQRS